MRSISTKYGCFWFYFLANVNFTRVDSYFSFIVHVKYNTVVIRRPTAFEHDSQPFFNYYFCLLLHLFY